MNKVLRYYVRAVLFLFPISFIPILANSFNFGKEWFLMVSAFIGLILWIISFLTAKEKVVKTNKVLGLLLITVIVSAIYFIRLGSGIQIRSLVEGLGFGTILSIFLWFFIWLQIADREEFSKGILALTISGIVTGIVSLVIFVLPAKSLPLLIPKKNTLISINSGWSLTGSLFSEVVLFVFLIGEWLKRLIVKMKEKVEVTDYIKEAFLVAFLGLILALDIYKIIKTGWTTLGLKTSWIIAVESLKNSPFFGVGLGNFVKAFNLYRPASFNLTKYWSGNFSLSSMGFLHIWTEMGLVGLALIFFGVLGWIKSKKIIKVWQITILILISLFLPLNLIPIFLLAWSLSSMEVFKIKEIKPLLKIGEKDFNVMPYVLTVVMLAGVGFGGFWYVRMFLGDFYFRNSLVAAANNNGSDTYNSQIKAIGINPNYAYYREIYSQTNLALAQNILSKENVSSEEKEQASTLVQQAVREAKAAVSLEENNPFYWSNLASIYRSLVGVVDGAADWSLQAYQQNLVLDPNNPTVSLSLGGLYYAAGKYDLAERAFETSVIAKQDYANAWYNWAYAAKKLNKLDVAVNRLQQALTLVESGSTDYDNANKELESWKEELSKAQAAAKEQTEKETTQQQNVQQQTGEKTKQVVETPVETVTPAMEVTPSPTL